MKEFFQRKENGLFLLIIAALLLFVSWQETQIANLQERMMYVEAARYDDQFAGLYWRATTVDEALEEQRKDIYHLQKRSADQEWRLMKLEWEIYGR